MHIYDGMVLYILYSALLKKNIIYKLFKNVYIYIYIYIYVYTRGAFNKFPDFICTGI